MTASVSRLPKSSPNSPFGTGARLHNRSQIEAVKKCASEAGRFTVILILKTPPDGDRRAAFLISRRFDLQAVRRNRARRLFRECWRRLYPRLLPCWVLLIPRKAIKGAKLDDVLPEVERAMSNAGVLKENQG
ncbi:MAG: ribonuclease P protein component [Victivallales bacterium]|nr:ribonuclease P protein component [Victivallales bacterium]